MVSWKRVGALAALWAGVAACQAGELGPPPDVVLVSVDTLRADRLGFAGYAPARTPNLDSLAARGMSFENASTPMPRTTPAMASLFTGLWPHHHGSREVLHPMDPLPSLASILALRGWETIGVSSSPALTERENLDVGFDRFEFEKLNAEGVTRLALEHVAKVPPDTPVFLWAHYLDPHTPYEAGTADCREVATKRGYTLAEVHANRDGLGAELLATCSGDYDREIAFTDEWIGALFAGLERLGRLPGALVVFTADHGEQLGEAGLYYEHGPTVNDASLRVPLVFAGPGVVAGVDRGPASLEDVMPTLLSLLSVPDAIRPETDGADLSARVAGRAWGGDDKPVTFAESGSALHVELHRSLRSGRAGDVTCLNGRHFSLCARPGQEGLTLHDRRTDPRLERDVSAEHPKIRARLEAAHALWPVEEARERSVRGDGFKLVEVPLQNGGRRRLLYDLERDPRETADVAEENPAVVAHLGAALDRWTAELDTVSRRAARPERSDDTLERLRALGYVQ